MTTASLLRLAPAPALLGGTDPSPDEFRAVAGDVIRDMIRRDTELWARVQADPTLLRQFGFTIA